MSTYSNLKIELMVTGQNSATWGNVTNTNMGTAIEEAITGTADVSFSSADVTLTMSDTNAAQTARNLRLNLTGTSGGARILYLSLPSADFPATKNIEKAYIINNGLADAVTVRNKISGTASGASVVVPAGKTMWIYDDGTDIVDAVTYLTSLTLGTALSATSGGTGQSSYAVGDLLYASTTTALSKLADVATGNALISGGVGVAPSWGKVGLTTHVSGTLPVANGGTGAATLTGYVKGTGTTAMTAAATIPTSDLSGTVAATNGGTGQTVYAVGDLLYASTTTALSKLADVATGNALISGGVGVAPSYGKIGLTTHVSGTLPTANGGTNLTSFTSGGAVYATSTSVLATGTLPVTAGGTGQTTYTDGQLLIGNTTGNTLAKATLTAGSGISITNGSGTITIAATGGTGTVTSVGFTGGIVSVATATTTPALTIAGTSGGIPYFSSATTWATSAALAANSLVVGGGAGVAPSTTTTGTGVVTALGVAVGSAGAFVTFNGALGTPSSGTLTNCTFPTLNQNTTGSAATLTTARTLTIGSTGKTFDGSASVSWSLTEIGAAASGANTDITSLNASTTINGVVIGYRNIPRSTTTTTANVSDVGKCIAVSAGITFPNATFAAGDVISIYNNSASSVTITQGTGFTLYLAGTATTGNRTLAQRGIATIWCNSASDGVISGGGLT